MAAPYPTGGGAPYPGGAAPYPSGGGAAPPYPAGPGASSLSTRVELSVSGRDLADLDITSKSDPLCVLYVKDFGGETPWREFERTEQIKNSLNPVFAHKFLIDYMFEERQHVKFALYDVDSHSAELDAHDFLGAVETTLGEIVSGGQFKTFERPLNGGHISGKGFLLVKAEELASCKELYEFQFAGDKMKSNSVFSEYDPFFELYKVGDNQTGSLVYRSKHLANETHPHWPKFGLLAAQLCAGDQGRTVRVRVMDFENSGDHRLIGEFTCTVKELLKQGAKFDCFNTIKKKNKGVLTVVLAAVKIDHTFLDYIMAGVQVNCTVAIDFTGSNGKANNFNSLHFMGGVAENQYQRALRGVLEILQDYDSDKMFPALGFGARVNGHVSHEFPLTLIPNNPFCAGVDGVLRAYADCVPRVEFYGPTNFSPVIRHVANFAQQNPTGENYAILLILTDGIITDFDATAAAIVNASTLPMSIIIVGVGNADFSQMDTLDSDETPLMSPNGQRCSRDIVQFVPFNEVVRRAGNNMALARPALAKEVLAEVPRQFKRWYEARGLTPDNLPKPASAPYPSQS